MNDPRPNRLVPIIIGFALFMQTLDATVIANALPSMALAFGESPLRLNLAISAYLLSTAVFLPISSWAADRFGARRVFVISIVLFAVASLLCGISQTLPQLLAARVLQGLAGALMLPVGRLVLLKTVPKSQLVRAMAILTMPALLGPVLGPLIGGSIVTFSSWRWIFYINLPIGLLGVWLVQKYVPDVREETHPSLDVRGMVLVGAGLACLVLALENAGRGPLSTPWVVTLAAAGVVCLALYVFHAKRTPEPAVDLSLLRIPSFTATLVGGAFARLVVGASPFLMTLLLQVGFGMSAFEAGLVTFTSASGALFMKTTAPPIIRFFGFRRVLTVNTFITSAVLMAYALFTPTTPTLLIVLVLFTGGFFRSLQFTSLQALAFADVPPEKMSQASSLSSMGMQLTQAIGVGVAAMSVYVSLRLSGDAVLTGAHVSPAFIVVGGLSMLSLLFFVRLPHDVGAELSGRRASKSRTGNSTGATG